jgi:hypothetical protein
MMEAQPLIPRAVIPTEVGTHGNTQHTVCFGRK